MATTTSTAKTLTAFVWLLFAAASVCSAKEWHGIVPLHSRCDDVKRILKVAECGSSYDTDEGRVYITYSKNRCADGWNVPPGTVLTISVNPKAAQRLNELGLDLAKYKKEVSYDSPNFVSYSNEEEGVSITVTPDQKVSSIFYYEAAKDRDLRYPESFARRPVESNGDPQGTFKFDEYGDLKSHRRT